jgi:hypothetical protein
MRQTTIDIKRNIGILLGINSVVHFLGDGLEGTLILNESRIPPASDDQVSDLCVNILKTH